MIDLRSDATVEAVAKAIYESQWGAAKFESLEEPRQEYWRKIARAAIEALLGQLQMSEDGVCDITMDDYPDASLEWRKGFLEAFHYIGLVRDNEEDN